MESVCFAGRVEKDGSQFSSVSVPSKTPAKSGNGELAEEADGLTGFEGAHGGDSKWVCERMISALVRYVNMSVRIVESVGKVEGRGMDIRCRHDVLDVVEMLPVTLHRRG